MWTTTYITYITVVRQRQFWEDRPCFLPSWRGSAVEWCAGSHSTSCPLFCWGWRYGTRKHCRAGHGSWSYRRRGWFPTTSSAVDFESDLSRLPIQLAEQPPVSHWSRQKILLTIFSGAGMQFQLLINKWQYYFQNFTNTLFN